MYALEDKDSNLSCSRIIVEWRLDRNEKRNWWAGAPAWHLLSLSLSPCSPTPTSLSLSLAFDLGWNSTKQK
jgi:hypothetical protein